MRKYAINIDSEYSFEIDWNVHMYNHLLVYSDSESTIETTIEDSATNQGLLVFTMDFSNHENRRALIVSRFEAWASANGLKYTLYHKTRLP